MYEEDIQEKKSEAASYFGNLTMERVIKNENDRPRTGSLVFRIKRTLPKTNDDSGIKCSSPSADEISDEEQPENSLSPIKVRIPKTLLVRTESDTKSDDLKCNSPESLTIQNKDKDSNVLNDNATMKNIEAEATIASTTSTISEPQVPFKSHKKSRRAVSRVKVPMELRRRSGRIVHLQMQKECQRDSYMDVASNVDLKVQVVPGCDSTRIAPATVVKKRRKRKAVSHAVVECKKRKYTRRGRPPKSALEKNYSIRKKTWPIASGCDNVNIENITLQPLKNSVWTLVPRSLFESDFFKSQVLRVLPIRPQELSKHATSAAYFSPSAVTQPIPCIPGARMRLKYSRNAVNTVSAIHPQMPEGKNCKRPTVIYFKKNFNVCLTNRATAPDLQSQLPPKNESTEIHNDLLHLCDKYRMLDDATVKNCYELTGRSVSETDSMLSDLFSSSRNVTPYEKTENVCVKQSTSTNNFVPDSGSTEAMPNHPEMPDAPASPLSSFEDTDTLSRNIIVESLKILFDEAAVLP